MKTIDVEKVLSEMTLEEKAQICSGRDFWHSQDMERLDVPAVMMCDGPNGLRKQKGEGDHLGINVSIETVCYPTASAIASSFDTELLEELGETLGEECQAEHVGMLLGPGVNMKRSPLCGRNFEYFSEDPYLAGKIATAYVKGLQSKGVASCVKHFAANNQETRRMSGTSNMDERTLRELYLPAFEMVVKEGKTRSIMCAYNAVNGTFCSENGKLLTDILREEWGFEGFVVTDWGATKDRIKGIQAGVDLEMPGSVEGKVQNIVRAVEDGILDEAVLDKAVRNNLKFVNDWLINQKEGVSFDREAAHQKSADIAKECAVLLKNEDILPIDKTKKAAFIGEFAEKPRYQGAGSSHINVVHPVSALECIEGLQITYAKGYEAREEIVDEALMQEAVEAAQAAEIAVIFAGLPASFETEGCDRETMAMPENQNELIRAVSKVQKNVVVVLHGGSPMEMPWMDDVSGILCMYLGGDHVGRATVDLLFGDANPSGKLAETWPLKLEDNPSYLNFPGEDGVVNYQEGIFIGYRYYDKKKMDVQFPFGYGLSYTTFEYSDLKLDKGSITDEEILTVSCKVKNTGERFGKEAVQLYVSDKVSSVQRPVRELKGFRKIGLMPGEEKEITFQLDKRAFAYYEEKIHDWFIESGDFQIEIGASSRDIRLSADVQVNSSVQLPVHYSRQSIIGDLTKTVKGQAMLSRMMSGFEKFTGGESAEDVAGNLGEGSERMMQAMMMEMPLVAICTYGMMSEEELDGLITDLNS